MKKLLMRAKGLYFWYASMVVCLLFTYGATFMGISPDYFWNKVSVFQAKSLEEPLPGRDLMGSVRLSYQIPSAHQLATLFKNQSTSLDQIRAGKGRIPQFYLAKLPRDLKKLGGDSRKEAFLQSILPLIVKAHQGIVTLRTHLMTLQEKEKKEGKLAPYEKEWLASLYDDYRIPPKDRNIPVLLARVDVIPISLTLAQAIIESGWGTSKLAQKSNSLFGHTNGQSKMVAYDDLSGTVQDYVTNLNRHPAYKGFRNKRLAMRAKSKKLDPFVLADELSRYSERGMAYVRDIKKIIKSNGLTQFDHITSVHENLTPSQRTV